MERAEKRELVATLNVQFKLNGSVVVAKYAGLTVANMTALRGKVRAAGGTVKVAKNRLAKLALVGTELEHMAHLFKGPTVILSSKDPVAASKVATDFAKTNDKFVILGGGLGKQALDVNGVKALAELPSLDELRAKIVGIINQPASKLASVVAAPGGALARVIKARADKEQAA
ncbi:50S ribosomal protein L10 [Siculibacillus lacustris]|uniref:Large ribosomal subunit protein uL10 n=1 Tax=Siculibacillus lacustris TaxID=1549641 RepID=A0A4Q9VDJ7_9HYPH|nr:50S ribosomal protein L10 [Siculibacillus lacustris]TBW32740.1 50S ribosomal protein L10 [Siculibacillus lacustris]